MHFLHSTSGVTLLFCLGTFLATSNAAPANSRRGSFIIPDFVKPHWYGVGKDMPENNAHFGPAQFYPPSHHDHGPKQDQVCLQCSYEVDACVNSFMITGTTDPDIDVSLYRQNCQCTQVRDNAFCRDKCGRTCQQWDYEGPYLTEYCPGCYSYDW
ncbi:uncharacterized protein M421DRAFT_421621 [Didymella exigua CBS 183.55]|uniref:Uncharacterized protein n=1 Tax=Didymella exigua CBS 183.55 TaxID=1150837 RepID=A0A6A5RJG7_9PLEO|nr:uncharacterized protein M421DRAFT_421621 [Didymella exigua CBS 183.55]KAF1927779.1 hypothetical protein M421DRAFT_421621 [Didymella exigua CBS 183.55]